MKYLTAILFTILFSCSPNKNIERYKAPNSNEIQKIVITQRIKESPEKNTIMPQIVWQSTVTKPEVISWFFNVYTEDAKAEMMKYIKFYSVEFEVSGRKEILLISRDGSVFTDGNLNFRVNNEKALEFIALMEELKKLNDSQ